MACGSLYAEIKKSIIASRSENDEGQLSAEKNRGSNEDISTSDANVRNTKKTDMLLRIESKPEIFVSDQTPTPIRLIQKCEEMGLFQDLQSNPFEETFRKAAEDIRSGTKFLEVPRIAEPNNADDSLHTPHIVFLSGGPNTKPTKKPLSPSSLVSEKNSIHEDPLCISLDDSVEETFSSDKKQSSERIEVEESSSTIQYFVTVSDGKVVQPPLKEARQSDISPLGSTDIPKRVENTQLKSWVEGMMDSRQNDSSDSYLVAVDQSVEHNSLDIFNTNGCSQDREVYSLNETPEITSNSSKSSANCAEKQQPSKMSLAKLKLKEALMNNTCPASSSGSTSSAKPSSRIKSPVASSTQLQETRIRRPSSTSDEFEAHEDSNRDVTSAEEKRIRNRAAAMRSREKRKTWVKELEHRSNDMLKTNSQLQFEVSQLREEVVHLKTLLLAHRDCPVTRALLEGKETVQSSPAAALTIQPSIKLISVPPIGTEPLKSKKHTANKVLLPKPPVTSGETSKSPNQASKQSILLNDPPVKRKRISSSKSGIAREAPSADIVVSGLTSSAPSSVVQTVFVPQNSSTFLGSNFLKVVPRVILANSATSISTSQLPSQVIYSNILPPLSPIAQTVKPSCRELILPPKTSTNTSSEKNTSVGKSVAQVKLQTKLSGNRSTQMLSSNVIKVNPNVVDCGGFDSDVLFIDEGHQ